MSNRSEPESLQGTLAEMNLHPLSPAWAKLEILLGLSAAAVGIRLLVSDSALAMAGGALFVLGFYLALAGNRSHLYQSMNKQTAFIAQLIREKGRSDG